MTNQTNGNSESQNINVADRLKQFEDNLEQYSVSLGLNFIKYNNAVQRAFDLSEQDIKNMDAAELGEISYFLSNYSLYIQKESNREIAKKNWASANLNKIVANNSSGFSQYMKYEEKVCNICNTNSAALELNKIIVACSTKIDELTGVADKLNSMAYRLDELHKTKRKMV